MDREEKDNEFYRQVPAYQRYKYNQGMIWVPIVIGLSVAAGVMTTRAIQRASQSKTTEKIIHKAKGGTSYDLPNDAQTKLTAKTFTGLPYSGDFKNPMDGTEAALILGCRETSSKKTVSQRFRTLMKLNHPDKGGSPFIAAKINEAHSILQRTASD